VRAKLACTAILVAGSASAALPTPSGATFTLFSRPTTVRFPDVAYDATTGAFLVVSGQSGVTARFVEAAGPAGDPFDVTTESTALSPRVASTGDGFLACWLVEAEQAVKCRSVSRSAGTPVLGAVQTLDSGAMDKHGESAPSLRCATAASECLVTWVDSPGIDLHAQRVLPDGTPLGPAMDLAMTANVFEAFPSVAFDALSNEYWVAYTREPDSQPMALYAVRVAVGADVPVVSPFELYTATGLNNYPEIAHDPSQDRFLAISWLNEGNPDVAGRVFTAAGTPYADRFLVAGSSGFEGGDGIGLAFDRALDTYLAVYQGPETPGETQQVWAAPVSSSGEPAAEFQATTSSATKGVYQPRVAADDQGRFLVVTVADYQRVDAQFVIGDVPVDAGTGTGGQAGAGTGGSPNLGGSVGIGGSSGAKTAPTDPASDGCGCRTSKRRATDGAPWLMLMALGFRRRRSLRAGDMRRCPATTRN
jgi:hypothetical protein